jgi:hypothetical protein
LRNVMMTVPLTDFSIPLWAPKPVADLHGRFLSLVAEYRQAGIAVVSLRGSTKDVERDARANESRGLIDGAKVRPAVEVIAEHHARLIAAQSRKASLETAVDVVGNELAAVIAEHRDEWLTAIDANEVDAAESYVNALDAAAAVLAALAPAARAREWLHDFNADAARIGNQTQFSGGCIRVEVSRRTVIDGEADPAGLLEICRGAVARKPAPVAS